MNQIFCDWHFRGQTVVALAMVITALTPISTCGVTAKLPGIQLQNGQEIETSFSAGSSTTFDFLVQTPGTVRVSVGETAGFNAEPVVEVFDSENVLVATASTNSGSDVVVQFETLDTGQFQIIVSDNGNNEPMEFRIRAFAIPDTPQLIPGRDHNIANGEEIISSLPLGSFTIFPFQIDSPGTIRVSIGETDATPAAEPFAQIFSPSGNLIDDDTGFDHAFIEITYFETGTYYIVVGDQNNDEPLQFQLRVFSFPGDPILIGGRDQVIANGEEVLSSFPLGSFCVFPFEVEQAGSVLVAVGETGAGLPANPFLRVFSPSGQQVATDGDSSNAFVAFLTFEIGTFHIVVAEGATDDPMEFRVRALSLPGNPTLLNGVDQPLQNGISESSTIPIGGFAIFPFFVQDAGLVTINVGETGAGQPAEPFLRVYDPSGVLLESDTDGTDATVQFTTFFTGEYTAVVTDNFTDEAMSFNIVATGISNNPPGLLGDVNGDGNVNLLDVAPFVALLSSGDYQIEADINQDGVVNLLDVTPFIELLSG